MYSFSTAMRGFFLSTCILLLLQTVLTSAYSSYEDDDAGFERGRRGWSMMRLGRGLQMLRLGKRGALKRMQDKQRQLQQQQRESGDSSTSSSSGGSSAGASALTPAQLRAVLSAILDENKEREETRRHPPLPRYGRELDLSVDSDSEFYPAFSQDAGLWAPQGLPLGFPRSFSHARVKRDASGQRGGQGLEGVQVEVSDMPYGEEWGAFGNSRSRAVALPRIGRYLGNFYKFRPVKAVPAPRIGRQEAGSPDSDVTLHAPQAPGDHMTNARAVPQKRSYSLDAEQKAVESAAAN